MTIPNQLDMSTGYPTCVRRFPACRGLVQSREHDIFSNHFVSNQLLDEFEVFVSSSDELRDRQIVDFETQPGYTVGVLVFHNDHPILPAAR